MRVLISGASVAGPALAYWLTRYGFTVTVVERAPALRKAGGHAVDLFKPAMDIVERMGVLEQVVARKTGTERLTLHTERGARVDLELRRILGAVSDRHVEIMRDDLSEIFYEATRHDAEYVFGDSITSISEEGEVTFERGEPDRFDLVIGADGLHSNVRRLVFGPESRFTHWVGAYLAVISVPNFLGLDNHMEGIAAVGRMAVMYGAAHLDDARAGFFFRTPQPLDYHHRDVTRQKELLREHFAGLGWEVPRLLAELDRTPAFYFDSITQLRLDTWSSGRVTLVGDAGYCPGPAVGGSTSLAVVGAYVLAGELAAHGGDHTRAYPAYEAEIGEYVRRSRTFAMNAAKRIVPGSRSDLWTMTQGVRLVNRLPVALTRAAIKLGSKGVRLHDSIALKSYAAPRETTSHP
ncbi:FAD-dependent monooxygenase [Nonomuraea rubra]|uniref:2-polyprenyl-6-methoxyphenol hydroxylase-like FAD-dependent oxidoreductase n=1 Tax=Nonomuraea rubra TaxID=46180 RepID=A0A7X0NQE6_9ACTN|nr:FAD-dependent monooxygenase [Nonomuraea rubra]MBB6547707.1 2-polyprenyl-6-methoxyphenol hydroxylase-like FAD-dependent oxidoreductase [Nonomuraea rubra]